MIILTAILIYNFKNCSKIENLSKHHSSKYKRLIVSLLKQIVPLFIFSTPLTINGNFLFFRTPGKSFLIFKDHFFQNFLKHHKVDCLYL